MVKLIAVKMTHFNMTYRNGSFMSLGIENKLWLTEKIVFGTFLRLFSHLFFDCAPLFCIHEFVSSLFCCWSYVSHIDIIFTYYCYCCYDCLIQHLETKCNILFLFFFSVMNVWILLDWIIGILGRMWKK